MFDGRIPIDWVVYGMEEGLFTQNDLHTRKITLNEILTGSLIGSMGTMVCLDESDCLKIEAIGPVKMAEAHLNFNTISIF